MRIGVSNDEKGKFSTQIGQDLIDAALKSVAKKVPDSPVAGVPAEVDVPVDAEQPGTDPAIGVVGASAPSELETVKAELELSMAKGRELMEKLKDEHEKMLRATADLDNFKKRAQKEKEEMQRYGNERLLRDFLPVIDNLDRALEHGRTAEDWESFHKGVAMTRKLFEDTLGKFAVKSFSAVGKPFDPRLHEAMQQVETKDVPPNHVVSELVRGYTLNERLMRPALVAVAVAPAASTEAAPAAAPAKVEPEPGA